MLADESFLQADSALSLFHNRNEEIGKKYMGAEGGIRTWLEAGKVADAPEYLSKEVYHPPTFYDTNLKALLMWMLMRLKDREYDQKFFSAENGGFGPSINWYRAQLEDLNDKDDKGRLFLLPSILPT
jgi:hypothetical protein